MTDPDTTAGRPDEDDPLGYASRTHEVTFERPDTTPARADRTALLRAALGEVVGSMSWQPDGTGIVRDAEAWRTLVGRIVMATNGDNDGQAPMGVPATRDTPSELHELARHIADDWNGRPDVCPHCGHSSIGCTRDTPSLTVERLLRERIEEAVPPCHGDDICEVHHELIFDGRCEDWDRGVRDALLLALQPEEQTAEEVRREVDEVGR